VPIARLLRSGTVLLRSDLEYERSDTPRPRALWSMLTKPRPAGLGRPTELGPRHPNVATHFPVLDEIELPLVGVLRDIEVAYRMFERWTQENFFRYMRQHFALDALVNYQVEPADPERSIPNPERKALAKELSASRAVVKELEGTYGQQARANPEAQRPTMRGFKIAQAALGEQISAAQAKCEQLQERLAALPKRVPLKEVVDEAEIVRLAPEAKHLTDTIKMLAFRAETALVRCLTQNGVRTEDDGRALVREMLLSSADIVPQVEQKCLLVRVHSLANPRHNKALASLCETLNTLENCYPGTDLTMVYEAPPVA